MYFSVPPNGYREYSEGFVVEFLKRDGKRWIGNFETGNSNLEFVCRLGDDNILVIARGICYMIDPENHHSFEIPGFDYKNVVEHENLFILVGEYSITVVRSRQEVQHFPNLCLDGISDVRIIGDALHGTLHDFDSNGNFTETHFTLDLDTFKFKTLNNRKSWWEILK